ncbi:hypothetical protein ADUPG1_005011, partial [Aduncisulcus paluster]
MGIFCKVSGKMTGHGCAGPVADKVDNFTLLAEAFGPFFPDRKSFIATVLTAIDSAYFYGTKAVLQFFRVFIPQSFFPVLKVLWQQYRAGEWSVHEIPEHNNSYPRQLQYVPAWFSK